MNGQLSQTDRLFRDTLVHRAEADSLEMLSEIFGAPKPENWPEDSWRSAFHCVAYGTRGTLPNCFAFIDKAHKHLHRTVLVNVDPANPHRITAVGGAGTFVQNDVGAFIRIENKIYYASGPADIASAGGAFLDLAPTNTAYFNAANFQTATTLSAEILVFTLTEPCPGPTDSEHKDLACKVFLNLFSSQALVPPAYLKEHAKWILYDAETGPFTVGKTLVGATSGASAQIRKIVDNGSTGILMLGPITGTLNFMNDETIAESDGSGSATSNGIPGPLLQLYDNETGGGFSFGDTVLGLTSTTQGTVRGIQDNGSSGILVIDGFGSFINDEVIIKFGFPAIGVTADGNTRALESAQGQPDGGILLPNEVDDGNQDTGPHPVYLFADGQSVILERLNLFLAAGVEAIGKLAYE